MSMSMQSPSEAQPPHAIPHEAGDPCSLEPRRGERRGGPVKNAIVRTLLYFSRWYMRNPLFRLGKNTYWKKICIPYLAWRDVEMTCRTHGGIRMNLRLREFIQNRLFFFGVWEPNITALFDSLLQPGDVVIDVGANIGYYTLLAARKVGAGGHVYAVEPNPAVHSLLKRHLEMNGLGNVTPIADAAWDTTASGTLHVHDYDCGATSLRNFDGSEAGAQVQLVRLDDVVQQEHRHRVRLIKIDIEGAEAHALRGLSSILAGNPRVRVVAEVHRTILAGMGSSAEALFAFMADLGFQAYQIPNSYKETAYFPPFRYEGPRPVHSPPVEPAYVLFSRMKPW